MIDFHLVYRQGAPSPYFDLARASVVPHPLYCLEDLQGYIQGRIDGFAMGTNPYVSFVDDDDEVCNVEEVIAYLKINPVDALYTNSEIIDAEGNRKFLFYDEHHTHTNEAIKMGYTMVHQLVVAKREIVLKAAAKAKATVEALNLQGIFDQALFLEISRATQWTYFPQVCYRWRHWDTNQQAHGNLKGGQRHKLATAYQDKP